jgi:hypothetical protein
MDKRVSNWRTMPALCNKYLSACREILFQQICALVKIFALQNDCVGVLAFGFSNSALFNGKFVLLDVVFP